MDKITTTFIVVTDLTEHMEEELKRYTADLEKAELLYLKVSSAGPQLLQVLAMPLLQLMLKVKLRL